MWYMLYIVWIVFILMFFNWCKSRDIRNSWQDKKTIKFVWSTYFYMDGHASRVVYRKFCLGCGRAYSWWNSSSGFNGVHWLSYNQMQESWESLGSYLSMIIFSTSSWLNLILVLHTISSVHLLILICMQDKDCRSSLWMLHLQKFISSWHPRLWWWRTGNLSIGLNTCPDWM